MGRSSPPTRHADPAPGTTPGGWDGGPEARAGARGAKPVRRVLAWLTVLLALGGAGYWYYGRPSEPAAQEAAGRRRGGGDPVPVLAAKAERRDMPVFLDGLGTVQAFNTVSVRPLVEGTLIEVLFTEGQEVRAGDVLARIDPRPYQATLDQAVAKKQQDEAALANARQDAARFARLAANAYTSAQQADAARAQVAQLEAQVRADQAAIDQARTQLDHTTVASPIDGRTGIRQVDRGNVVRPGDTTPLTVITQLKPVSVVFTLPQQALPAVAASMEGGARPEVQALRQAAGAGSGAPPLLDRGSLAVLDNQVDPQTGTIKLKATFANEGLRLWPGGFVHVRLLAETLRGATVVPTAAVQRGPRGPFVYVVDLANPAPPEPGAPPVAGGGAVSRANAAAAQAPSPPGGATGDATQTQAAAGAARDAAPRGVFPAARRNVRVGHEDAGYSLVLDGVAPGETVVTDGAQRLTDGGKVAIAGPDGNAPEAAPPREPGRRRGG